MTFWVGLRTKSTKGAKRVSKHFKETRTMKIYKNGKLFTKGKSIAVSSFTENGTNDFLVDIHENGNKQALRVVRDCNTSRITLCEGEEFCIPNIIGDVFVKTWADGYFGTSFRLTEEFLSNIKDIAQAALMLKNYADHIFLI